MRHVPRQHFFDLPDGRVLGIGPLHESDFACEVLHGLVGR
jgi:hypothetical protein